ncbi:unnamed protein product [Withania somnifera]
MGKISFVAALLLCLLAFASADTFTVTVTEDDMANPQSCQQQIQRQRLNNCRSHHYYGDELSMVTDDNEINQGQQYFQKCCQELRSIDTQCRCPAIRRMVTQERGSQGEEAQQMLGRSRYLPHMCKIQPTQCSF